MTDRELRFYEDAWATVRAQDGFRGEFVTGTGLLL